MTRASVLKIDPWDMLVLLHCSTYPAPHAVLELRVLQVGNSTVLEPKSLAGLTQLPVPELVREFATLSRVPACAFPGADVC